MTAEQLKSLFHKSHPSLNLTELEKAIVEGCCEDLSSKHPKLTNINEIKELLDFTVTSIHHAVSKVALQSIKDSDEITTTIEYRGKSVSVRRKRPYDIFDLYNRTDDDNN